jgi:hypothetical protein
MGLETTRCAREDRMKPTTKRLGRRTARMVA